GGDRAPAGLAAGRGAGRRARGAGGGVRGAAAVRLAPRAGRRYARSMSVAEKHPAPHTIADLLAIPEHQRFHELIDGHLVHKALPSARHGAAQNATSQLLRPFNRRPGGTGGPGGWWFATEVEVELA